MKTASNESMPLVSRILYLGKDCVVVNKLSGEAVEGAGQGMGDLPGQLALALAEKVGVPELERPEAVQRLDVPVTGCALFALTKPGLSFLNDVFVSGKAEKRYWAVVEKPDRLPPESGELVHWIRFDKGKNKSFAHDTAGPGRKKAVLRYRLAGEGRNYLFFEIELLTGRHHQIRAQFARLGLHIKGDLKYGARRSEKTGGIRLHARSLSFPDPAGSGPISVQADPPVMDGLWEAFPALIQSDIEIIPGKKGNAGLAI